MSCISRVEMSREKVAMRSSRPPGCISAAIAGSIVPSGSRAGAATTGHTCASMSGSWIGFGVSATTTSQVMNEPVGIPVFVFVSETLTG